MIQDGRFAACLVKIQKPRRLPTMPPTKHKKVIPDARIKIVQVKMRIQHDYLMVV